MREGKVLSKSFAAFILGVTGLTICSAGMAHAEVAHKIQKAAAVHMVSVLAPVSPALSAEDKTAISQDINGVPLSKPAKKHAFGAEIVFCKKRVIDGGAPAECKVDFGAGKTSILQGKDGEALYKALGEAKVEDDAGAGHIIRAIHGLKCTVDDKIAQETPSNGDDVAGISCQFQLGQDSAAMQAPASEVLDKTVRQSNKPVMGKPHDFKASAYGCCSFGGEAHNGKGAGLDISVTNVGECKIAPSQIENNTEWEGYSILFSLAKDVQLNSKVFQEVKSQGKPVHYKGSTKIIFTLPDGKNYSLPIVAEISSEKNFFKYAAKNLDGVDKIDHLLEALASANSVVVSLEGTDIAETFPLASAGKSLKSVAGQCKGKWKVAEK